MADDNEKTLLFNINVRAEQAQASLSATEAALDKISESAGRTTVNLKIFQQVYGDSTNALNAATQSLSQQLSGVNERLVNEQEILQALGGGLRNVTNATDEQLTAMDALADSFRDDQLQVEIDRMVQLEAATRAETEAARALRDERDQAESARVGYGVSGGLPGPAEAGAEDPGQIGSVFGIAHGLRAASGLAGGGGGAQLFTGGADVLYLTQGFRQLSEIFPKLNAAIENSPGLLEPLVSGLDAAGVGMAGLTAVVLPLAAGALVAAGALKVLDDEMANSKEVLEQAISQLDKYYEDLKKSPDQLKQEQADLPTQLAQAREHEAQAAKAVADATKQITDTYGYQVGGGIILLEKAGQLGGGLKDLGEEYDKAKAKTKELEGSQVAVNQALDNMDVIFQGLRDTLPAVNDWFKGVQQSAQLLLDQAADKNIADVVEDAKLKATASAKSIKDNITEIDVQRAAIQEELDKGGLSTEKVTELKRQLGDLAEKEDDLKNSVLPVVEAREREIQRAKDEKKALDDLAQAQETHTNAVRAAQDQLQNQSAEALTKYGQDERQYFEGSLQDTEARYQISLKESRDEVKIHQDTADAIIDIQNKTGNAMLDAGRTWNRQQYDDVLKTTNLSAKNQLDIQHQTETDALEHNQKLADLRKANQKDEIWNLLNGNFLQIYKDQFQKDDPIKKENDRFADQQQQRGLHNKQTQENQALAMQQERAAQLLAYQRKLDDLQTSEDREITQKHTAEDRKIQIARDSEQQQIADLNHTEAYKLQLLSVGLQQELQLYQRQEAVRLQLAQANADSAIMAGAQALAATDKGPTGPRLINRGRVFDDGGTAGPGEMWAKGGLKETVQAGGKAFNLGGSALVYPLTNMSVTPAGNGPIGPITIPITINDAHDPAATAKQVGEAIEGVFRSYFH